MRAFLFFGGAAIECVGILFVASPDLFPLAARVVRSFGARLSQVWRRALRLFGVRRTVTAKASLGAMLVMGTRATFEKNIKDEATLEEKVAFLLRRDKEAQSDVQALAHRFDDLETALDPRLDDLRDSMAAHVGTSLEAVHRAYLPLRRLGVVLLVVGLAMATSGNFVD